SSGLQTGRVRVPFVPWVVHSITTDPQADGSDQRVFGVSTFEYDGGKYDFKHHEFLGFRRVTEKRPVVAPDGQTSGMLAVDRSYYQDEQPADATPNPLKGMLASEVRRSDPEGQVETERGEHAYTIVSAQTGSMVRFIRPTTITSTTFKGDKKVVAL